jgi:polysaccharide pyruvyl transferase WcaK-like protein
VLKKQVFIVNHSVFPDDGQRYAGRTTDALYRRVYQLADYVAVRDRRSSAVLRDLGIPGVDSFDCSVIAVTPKRVSRDRRIVVGASAAYANVEAFLGIFRQLSREGWDCRFIFGAPARPARDDQRFMSEMAVLGGGLPFKEVADADEFVGEIQRSALLVSGRFHYTIVAHCLGTPYVVLGANTPKNDALCAALGSPPPIPWTAADLRGRIMQAVAARIEPAGEPSLARLRALARRNLP